MSLNPFAINIGSPQKVERIRKRVRTGGRKAETSHSETPWDSRPLATVVDDDEVAARLLAWHLNELGFRVQLALNYREGFSKLLTDSDIIFMDWILDEKTGGRLLKNLDEVGVAGVDQKTPVVTVSTLDYSGVSLPDFRQLEYLGHIQKPLTRKKLSHVIGEITQAPY